LILAEASPAGTSRPSSVAVDAGDGDPPDRMHDTGMWLTEAASVP